MTILTGDTHRDFKRIDEFCQKFDLTEDDLLIILGDVGINYLGGTVDTEFKRLLVSNCISIGYY